MQQLFSNSTKSLPVNKQKSLNQVTSCSIKLTCWICKLFCDFWIFAELDAVVSNVFHEYCLQTDIVADFKLVQVKVRLSRQALGWFYIPVHINSLNQVEIKLQKLTEPRQEWNHLRQCNIFKEKLISTNCSKYNYFLLINALHLYNF